MKNVYVYKAAYALLAVLGAWNLFHETSYFVRSWQTLHSQWISHAYMVLMLLFSWLGYFVLALVPAFCFTGLLLIKEDDSILGLVGKTVGGALVSLVLPSLVVLAWFLLIATTHGWLEKIL